MKRQIPFLIILTLGLTCISSRNKNIVEHNVDQEVTQLGFVSSNNTNKKVKEKIRFDFTVGRINTFENAIEIKASLFNDNEDTIYFLSSSCDGEQYSLRYNKSKFILTPFINCNSTYPRLMKIAPKGQYNFQAHYRCANKETKIKLGFDFYSVDKSFNLKNKNVKDINIFNRPNDKQTIIWADEKIIE